MVAEQAIGSNLHLHLSDYRWNAAQGLDEATIAVDFNIQAVDDAVVWLSVLVEVIEVTRHTL